jgi:hypothetical protein
VARMCWTGIMTLRTWAMWRQNIVVSRLLCVLGPAFAILAVIFVPIKDTELRRKFRYELCAFPVLPVLTCGSVPGWTQWDPERGMCVSTGYAASWVKIPAVLDAVYILFLTAIMTFRCLQYARFSSNGSSFFSSNIVRQIHNLSIYLDEPTACFRLEP